MNRVAPPPILLPAASEIKGGPDNTQAVYYSVSGRPVFYFCFMFS